MSTTHLIDPQKLDKLAAVAVRVGLNLREGQDLILTAPLEAAPLARLIIKHAYQAGAGLVTVLYNDEEASLLRFAHAPEASFDRAAEWLYRGMAEAYNNNTARLAISGENPTLLAGQDPAKVARLGKANSIAMKPAMEPITRFATNWCIVSYPTRAWAQQVFPKATPDDAVRQLAEAIFAISRIEGADPVADWNAHNANLHARADWLNSHNFHALRFTGPGTDLTVGLADGHAWHAAAATAKNGILCNANIPTEEVFTTPHARRVDGTASSTKPLSYRGSLIDGITVRYEGGKIVEGRATVGNDAFQAMIASDEGAARLGEVALVPHSSPISQSGLLFFNTLYDENAACHIAQGQCYTSCFTDPDQSAEAVAAAGGNASIIHVDWMIGSNHINVDGLTADGQTTPVMRNGEWAF